MGNALHNMSRYHSFQSTRNLLNSILVFNFQTYIRENLRNLLRIKVELYILF